MNLFIRRVLSIYRPFRGATILILVLTLVYQIIQLVSPYLLGQVVNKVLAGIAYSKVIPLAFYALLALITGTLISLLRELLEVRYIDGKLGNFVSKQTLNKVMTLSIGQHKNQHSGLTQGVIFKGEKSVINMAFMITYQILPMLVELLVTIVALFLFAPIFGFVIVVGVTTFFIATYFLNSHFTKKIKEINDEADDISKQRNEAIRNLSTVQANAQEQRIIREYDTKIEEHRLNFEKVWGRFVSWSHARSFITHLTRFSGLSFGIFYVYQGKLLPGDLIFSMMWLGTALANLGMIARMHRNLLTMSVEIKKYFTILDVEPAIKVKPDAEKLQKIEGNIEFRDVSFVYPNLKYIPDSKKKVSKGEDKPQKEALCGVSFSIKAGERIALVGPSGSGKSTIISLLQRAYDPNSGSILIDGHNLRDIDLVAYRQHLGVVDQNISLFDDTLGRNMVFGVENENLVSEKMLDTVSEKSRINHFFDRLTNKYETMLGENGIQLSGGERQRVGIARALIKEPSLLILDEATSSLDPQNERLIKQSIDEASKGRTTIIIAHRLSTVRDVDKIFVVNKGEIADSGTHDELLKKSELYRELVKDQMIHV
jgi:ABC-type multidrug transport system fused ATPase/permease subunit